MEWPNTYEGGNDEVDYLSALGATTSLLADMHNF